MNFFKLFFKSFEMAGRVDRKRLVNDTSYSMELIDELCPDEPAAEGGKAKGRDRRRPDRQLPYPA